MVDYKEEQEIDLLVVELPDGQWTYQKKDGTLATSLYRHSGGALGAGLRQELKLKIKYQYRIGR